MYAIGSAYLSLSWRWRSRDEDLRSLLCSSIVAGSGALQSRSQAHSSMTDTLTFTPLGH
jgi:hypothetical protein